MNQYEFEEKLVRKYFYKRIPLKGIFELTGRCTLNCKMCYVHTKSNAEFLRNERDGDWWISQVDAACERGLMFATLTGGECMLHPDFKRIYSYLRKQGVYTRINTNGMLLTEDMVEFLKEAPPFEIQITIYGASDDAYERVTGVRAFRTVEEAIKRVREAGLNMRIAITPNSYAPGETEKIIDYAKKENLLFSINQAIFTQYDDEEEQTTSIDYIDIDEQIRYHRKAKNITETVNAEIDLPPAGGDAKEPDIGIKCSAGRNAFMITNNGYMQPCSTMYHLRAPLNSAEEFDAAWKAMLEVGNNYLMPIECEGCAYFKACLSCPVARGGRVGNGHCDPAVCEMTRKLVAAGVKKLEQAEKSCD